MKSPRFAGLLFALAIPFASAQAGQSVSLILNWTPAADHSPFYYAKAQGWYEKAGIDLSIEVGKGSGVSSLKVGSGAAPFGISDLATMLVARSKGADAVALMSIYANTGQTFYWLKSYGVNGPKDFAGRKIGMFQCENFPFNGANHSANGIAFSARLMKMNPSQSARFTGRRE